MIIQSTFLPSAFRHSEGQPLPETPCPGLTLLQGERFAVQLALTVDEPVLLSLADFNSIGDRGLTPRLRVALAATAALEISAAFVGYVPDDCGTRVADPILREQSRYIEAGTPQLIWIEGVARTDSGAQAAGIDITLWSQQGYDPEVRQLHTHLAVVVSNRKMPALADSDFHLDLWQHLSSWARMYEVPLWSEDHFTLIENYIAELASMGAKVVTVMASDFPWAGQGCYRVENNDKQAPEKKSAEGHKKNRANLFEHKITRITRNKKGDFICDFTALERYLAICFRHGIDREIAVFGLLGNWDSRLFGNPLTDYHDPIRISYFCEETQSYRYMDSCEQVKAYLVQLFAFFRHQGVLDKVRIFSDEPDNATPFSQWSQFIRQCSGGDVPIKAALHRDRFSREFNGLSDISFSLPLLLDRQQQLEDIKASLPGKLTWYVCCMPEKPNHFLSSPLIESRLTGWFSFYFALEGFLRWDYAFWPEAPLEQVSYKYPQWQAGDMFFVYPGKDMKPLRSLRWENLRFGFQDMQIMNMACQQVGRKPIEQLLEQVLGKKSAMHSRGEFSVAMTFSLDYSEYMAIRQKINGLLDQE